jgi:hypothetical protein
VHDPYGLSDPWVLIREHLDGIDALGLSLNCGATVTVDDTTPPEIACAGDAMIAADGNCKAFIPDLSPGLSGADNCTAANALTVSQAPPVGTIVGAGRTRSR